MWYFVFYAKLLYYLVFSLAVPWKKKRQILRNMVQAKRNHLRKTVTRRIATRRKRGTARAMMRSWCPRRNWLEQRKRQLAKRNLKRKSFGSKRKKRRNWRKTTTITTRIRRWAAAVWAAAAVAAATAAGTLKKSPLSYHQQDLAITSIDEVLNPHQNTKKKEVRYNIISFFFYHLLPIRLNQLNNYQLQQMFNPLK